jgi:hypothetical protein
MRLVDADALKAEFDKNCAMECACCDNATCNHVRNAVGCGLVDAAPTIDAIPVEWMREKMQKPQMTCANPFGYVLAEWLEEQEAR